MMVCYVGVRLCYVTYVNRKIDFEDHYILNGAVSKLVTSFLKKIKKPREGILAMLFKTIWSPKRVVDVGFFWLMRRYFSVSSIAAIERASKDGELRVFVVAGEVSGDTIGSRLMASLRKHSVSYPFCWLMRSKIVFVYLLIIVFYNFIISLIFY